MLGTMPKWTEHRHAVKESLKRKRMTIYQLSGKLEGTMSRNLVYAYLRGDTGISMENAEAINRVLGLRYTDE